jgi:hypothetical protein
LILGPMPEKLEYRYAYPILLSNMQKHIEAASAMLKTPIDLLEIVPSETHLIIRIRPTVK